MDKAFLPVTLLLALAMFVAADARRLDCQKFVFAPSCRGIAAKRMGGDKNIINNANVPQDLQGTESRDYFAPSAVHGETSEGDNTVAEKLEDVIREEIYDDVANDAVPRTQESDVMKSVMSRALKKVHAILKEGNMVHH